MERRAFLLGVAGARSLAVADQKTVTEPRPKGPKRIAAVVTEYRPNSHADVIVGKYLEGYRQDDQDPRPRSHIASLYTAQAPANDMSRERAKKYGVPIFPTIAGALTLGGDSLAVDGVLLIGEHGDYPTNEKGQKMYPRYELFVEITDVFRRTRRAVPVFNDKHLSYSWTKAKRMVEISRELKFPFMAGSSVPVAFRKPPVDTPFGAKVRHGVAIGYGGIEAYGFHMLEGLQSMMERRAGGETGVKAVRCLENDAVWRYIDQTPWVRPLFDAALARGERRKAGDLRNLVRKPAVFLIEYRDGAEAAGFMLDPALEDFSVALEVEGRGEPLSTLMWLQNGRPYHHFECLVRNIEKMFESGRATYPAERTLLTSGVLDFLMESRIRGHQRLETPELDVRYRPSPESHFCVTNPPEKSGA